jgi:hypothetical protein
MNISGQISTKIDEEKGKVLILAAELRAEREPLNKGALRAKISQMYTNVDAAPRKTNQSAKKSPPFRSWSDDVNAVMFRLSIFLIKLINNVQLPTEHWHAGSRKQLLQDEPGQHWDPIQLRSGRSAEEIPHQLHVRPAPLSKNSEDVPEWMASTQSHHFRDNNKNRSLYTNTASPFKHVEQTYVYARLPRPSNPEGQFNRLIKNRARNNWELKNQTF